LVEVEACSGCDLLEKFSEEKGDLLPPPSVAGLHLKVSSVLDGYAAADQLDQVTCAGMAGVG